MNIITQALALPLEPSLSYLFVGGEIVAKEKTLKQIKDYIKKHYDSPKKDIKGYIIRIKIQKQLIIVNCVEITITPKLSLITLAEDGAQTFRYTLDDYKKYGFKMSHIKKMIKAVRDETISFEPNYIPISELLESKKPKEEIKTQALALPLEPSMVYLFVGGDIVAKEKSAKKIKEYLKEHYEPPKKNIKGYLIAFRIDKNDMNNLINISCVEKTITPKFMMAPTPDDGFQTFRYTLDDYKKYGFKISHIKKMIKAVRDETISFEPNYIPIREILS